MNVISILRSRELNGASRQLTTQYLLEDSFVSGNYTKSDYELPPTVSSTIAISMSCDGRTVASTHGDHTVKVFIFNSGLQLRVFRGHPRTPWTVKYHPRNSDILASGCLGFEVRVWSIERACCVHMVRLEASIISLAFHPSGQFLAIASGSTIEVWDWNRKRSNLYDQPNDFRPVVHKRNIRALLFHPAGSYLFVAAPDSPKLHNETSSYCRLFAIAFADLLDDSTNTSEPLCLSEQLVIVPQVHLYSDGGLDVDSDGRHLLTCAQIYSCHNAESVKSAHGAEGYSLSPMSHCERLYCDNAVVDHFDLGAADQDNSTPNFRVPGLRLADSLLMFSHTALPPPPPTHGSGLFSGLRSVLGVGPGVHQQSREASETFMYFSEPVSIQSSRLGVMNEANVGKRQIPIPPGDRPLFHSRPYNRLSDKSYIPLRLADSRLNGDLNGTDWMAEDHLCLLQLHFDKDGRIKMPTILNTKLLPGSLLKAVTSTKLSPTCRYALIGYGVREAGMVIDHPDNNQTACELINLQRRGLDSEAVMCDHDDEVNVAQFHPAAGNGVVYGTKKGKVRVFVKAGPGMQLW